MPTGSIVASEYLAEAAVERVRVTTDRVRVVRRWVDLAEFDPERVRGHRVSALAERWGLVAGAKVVVVPALPDGDRGHLLLLHAMARLPRTDCVALFAGGFEAAGVYGKELMAAVRRAGLGERVRFGGRTDDLPALLALADLVVLPTTLPESGGHVAAAAQAMGRPVIVCNRGALAEAVMPASTGWLVPAEDPDELGRALDLALAMDEPTRRRLAARARDFVAGEFGLAACADRMLAVYRELSELPLARAG